MSIKVVVSDTLDDVDVEHEFGVSFHPRERSYRAEHMQVK